MADYIFNIPGTGCTDKQIGSFSVEDCGQITSISTNSTWADVSITATTDGKILLTVPENSDVTNGRSEDVTISYTINGSTYSIIVSLCQANKHGDTPEPPAPIDKMLTLVTTSGDLYADCDEGGKVNINDATITALTTDKASIKSAKINGACVNKINEGTFTGCINLTSVTISEGVEELNGFGYDSTISPSSDACTSLREIYIPNSVEKISPSSSTHYGAFEGCTALTTCTFGENSKLNYIGRSSFEECTSLTDFNVPSGVTYFAGGACPYCTGLTSLTIDSSNTTYDSRDGCNAVMKTSDNVLVQGCVNTIIPNETTSIGKYAFQGMSNITAMTIPDAVTSIGEYAFSHCSGLTKVNSSTNGVCNIPSNVTSIGTYAFYNCENFTKLTIPDAVTSIGEDAFSSCGSLESVTIGSGVTSIDRWAFYVCNSLTSITIKATTPPALGEAAFNGTNDCPIYVPSASVNAYKTTTNWSEYADRIQAMP